MNLIIIGYGKMGKAIEASAKSQGHTISRIIKNGEIESLSSNNGDVAIEFTNPDSAFDNIYKCIKEGVPVISGTTGWLNRKNEIDKYCKESNGTFFYAANFSLGVNIFFKINEMVADIMGNYNYTVGINEIHHTQKKDTPSGTAIELAKSIIGRNPKYKRWSDKEGEDSIKIDSEREGEVPGTHFVNFVGEFDKIAISHEAKGREGFANGVIKVAEWIQGKKGILSMDDFLEI